MSTPRQGPAGTGGNDPAPQADPKKDEPAQPVMTDPPPPDVEAELRKRATADMTGPADTGMVTSRLPETTPFDITVDSDNVLRGSHTSSGFIVWFCPNKLLPRLKRHYLVTSGRIVMPEGVPDEEPKKPAAAKA